MLEFDPKLRSKGFINLIDSLFNPYRLNFKDSLNCKISIITTTSQQKITNKKKTLTEVEIKVFWKHVFMKLGYSENDIYGFGFNPSIPEKYFKIKKIK